MKKSFYTSFLTLSELGITNFIRGQLMVFSEKAENSE